MGNIPKGGLLIAFFLYLKPLFILIMVPIGRGETPLWITSNNTIQSQEWLCNSILASCDSPILIRTCSFADNIMKISLYDIYEHDKVYCGFVSATDSFAMQFHAIMEDSYPVWFRNSMWVTAYTCFPVIKRFFIH